MWKPYGLKKCLVRMDECVFLTRCLVRFNRWTVGSSSLRLVSGVIPIEKGEVEVDLRAEHERWQRDLQRGKRSSDDM